MWEKCVYVRLNQGSPVGSTVNNLPAKEQARVRPLGQEDPLEEETATTPGVLPGKSHGQRSLAGCGSWRHKIVGQD